MYPSLETPALIVLRKPLYIQVTAKFFLEVVENFFLVFTFKEK